MKKVSTAVKEKNVKADATKAVVKKAIVTKVEPAITETFKQEKLAETVKVSPVIEKKEEKKATVEKKTVAKKTAEKKASTVVKEEVFVQYGNQEVLTASIVDRVKAAYTAEGHKANSIESVRVYIKPEENMVYYVVNNDYASGISLF